MYIAQRTLFSISQWNYAYPEINATPTAPGHYGRDGRCTQHAGFLIGSCGEEQPVVGTPSSIHVGMPRPHNASSASSGWHRRGSGWHGEGEGTGGPPVVFLYLHNQATIPPSVFILVTEGESLLFPATFIYHFTPVSMETSRDITGCNREVGRSAEAAGSQWHRAEQMLKLEKCNFSAKSNEISGRRVEKH